MFCTRCGNALSDEALVCDNCSETVEQMVQALQDRKQLKKSVTKRKRLNRIKQLRSKPQKHRRAFAVVFAALVFLGIAMGAYFVWRPYNAQQTFVKNITADNYESAYKTYETELKRSHDMRDFEADIKPYLITKLSAVVSNYNNNTISTKEVDLAVSYFKDYSFIQQERQEAQRQIERLKQSKEQFEFGKKAIAAKYYLSGIKAFENVIESDNNHQMAKTYIAETGDIVKRLTLEEAEKLAAKKEHNYAVSLLKTVNETLDDDEIADYIAVYENMLDVYSRDLDENAKIIANDTEIIGKLQEMFPWLKPYSEEA